MQPDRSCRKVFSELIVRAKADEAGARHRQHSGETGERWGETPLGRGGETDPSRSEAQPGCDVERLVRTGRSRTGRVVR